MGYRECLFWVINDENATAPVLPDLGDKQTKNSKKKTFSAEIDYFGCHMVARAYWEVISDKTKLAISH